MRTRSSKPLLDVHTGFRRKIESGEWKLGAKLPTTAELARATGCSIGKISKAMAMLVHEGWIEQKTKIGSRVIRDASTVRTAAVELDAFALIYPTRQHEGMWEVVQGFQQAATGERRRIVTLSADGDFLREMELVKRLVEFDIQGVAILSIALSAGERIAFNRALLELRFPLVLIDQNPLGLACPAVYADYLHAGYVMTRYLVSKGLTRIGFFANNCLTASVRDRHRGYVWAMREAGLPSDGPAVFLEPAIHPDFVHPLTEPRAFARQYLAQAAGVEGVVCVDDLLATALIMEARSAGIAVPETLKVVGIDDHSFSRDDDFSITTYRLPNTRIGSAAFGILHAMVAGQAVAPTDTIIRGEIIARRSA